MLEQSGGHPVLANRIIRQLDFTKRDSKQTAIAAGQITSATAD